MMRFSGNGGKDCRPSSMVWADNSWLYSNDNEQPAALISEVTRELEELVMEPNQASLCWTRTCGDEEAEAITFGWRGKESAICARI